MTARKIHFEGKRGHTACGRKIKKTYLVAPDEEELDQYLLSEGEDKKDLDFFDLSASVIAVLDKVDPYAPREEFVCGRCLDESQESWRSVMRGIFEHGGSDEEREVFGEYFGR